MIEDRELTEVGGEVRVVRPQPSSGELDRLQVERFRLGGVPLEPVDLGEVQVADRQVRGIGLRSPFAKRQRTPGQGLGLGEVPLVLEEPREIILEPGEQRRCCGAQRLGAGDRLAKRTFRVDETVLLTVQLSQRVPRVEEFFDVIAGRSGVHANRFGEEWFGLGESPLADEHHAKRVEGFGKAEVARRQGAASYGERSAPPGFRVVPSPSQIGEGQHRVEALRGFSAVLAEGTGPQAERAPDRRLRRCDRLRRASRPLEDGGRQIVDRQGGGRGVDSRLCLPGADGRGEPGDRIRYATCGQGVEDTLLFDGDRQSRRLRSERGAQGGQYQDGPDADPAGDYHAGHLMSTIGHFHIVREIGRGGAGVVYLAEDVDIPGRRVALKRLRPEIAAVDADVLRREAAVLAAIEHPHILVVHEVGVAADGLYLVTEYLPEGSMADRIERRPLTEAEALAAARQTASALAAGHERGILHRDVKPANLLLASDGRVKVSDFGLAVHTVPTTAGSGDTTETVTLAGNAWSGGIFGTPLYIPPEALAGAAPSAAGDQFAFGVAFHEMLTGRRPFSRSRGIQAVLDAPSIDPRCPPDLARVVARCVAKDAKDRFASMAEVVAAIDKAIARRGHDRRRLTRVIAGVGVLAVVLLSGWRWNVWRAGREAQRLNEEGRAALEAGRFGDARRLFLSARGADPGYLAACTNLGALALLDSDPSWAVAILGDCAATFGDVDVVVYNHASALRRAGDLAGAERALRRAVELARGGPLELAALSEATLVLTARGKAREALAIAEPRRPTAADTTERAILLKSIGLAELADGSAVAAAATLKAAIAGPLPAGPRIDALVGLGHAEDLAGNREGAVAAFAEAIASGAAGEAQAEAMRGLGGDEPRPPGKSR